MVEGPSSQGRWGKGVRRENQGELLRQRGERLCS